MLHFVQKELEKSSVTEGFVRQQAFKGEEKKRGKNKDETPHCATPLSRTVVVAASIPCHTRYTHVAFGDSGAVSPESLSPAH